MAYKMKLRKGTLAGELQSSYRNCTDSIPWNGAINNKIHVTVTASFTPGESRSITEMRMAFLDS